MNKKNDNELKRCPWCGSEGLISTLSNIYNTVWVVTCSGENDNGCCGLAMNGFFEIEQEAIDAWNKRKGE